MFPRALRMTRINGIDVRLDPSLLVIALLVGWTFSMRFTLQQSLSLAIVMAVLATLLFFVSILVHELAHALEAQHRGIEVPSITLFLFGGVTEMHAGGRSPRDEFVISAVGPYASLVCGAVFGLIATLSEVLGEPLAGPIGEVAGVLAWLNIALAVFNLVPGAPLDGGRVLRAGLWWLLGDRHRALAIASRAGQLLALALIGYGAFVLWQGAQGSFAALWWIVIGMFIFQAARTELRQGQLDRVLDRHTVGDLLDEPAPVLQADRPLDLADAGEVSRLLPVVDDGRLVGVLPADTLRELHAADRGARTAGDLMRPVTSLPAVTTDAPLRELVELLVGEADRVAVERDGRPVAVLREPEVAHGLERLRRGETSGATGGAEREEARP